MINPPKRIVRFSYLIQATGLSRGTLYREMESNPEFPKKIILGIRAIGFDASEVDAYVAKIIEHGSTLFENNE
jgi:prophage regulatory protein